MAQRPHAERMLNDPDPQGNRERYYDPSNSLLDSVLTSRQGIPISLGVLHAAVSAVEGLGRACSVRLPARPATVIPAMLDCPALQVGARAGLRVQLLNVPMHVVTALDAPGDSAPGRTTRCFVDVFDGGRIMSRRASPGGSLCTRSSSSANFDPM